MKTLKRFLGYIHVAFALVPLCSSAQVMRVAEMDGHKVENIPPYYQSWTYSDEYDTSSGSGHSGNSNNDVRYYFTVAQPAIAVISTSGSALDETSLYLMGAALYANHETECFSDSSVISEEQRSMIDVVMRNMDTDLAENMKHLKEGQAFLSVPLQAGYYSLCSEGSDIGVPNNGKIKTSIYVCYLGQSMDNPINLGVHGQEFKTQCVYMTNTFEGSGPLYFKVSFTSLTELSVDGVGVRGTYGKLSVMNAAGQVLYSSDQYATKKYYPQIDKCRLSPGTYYICSYFESGAGELFVNIRSAPVVKRGDGMGAPYILPSFFTSGTHTIEYNTEAYTDRYQANSRKDVFVGLRLLVPFNIVMENSGSTVAGGIIVTLADNQGKSIVRLDTSENPEMKVSADVSSGFYYLILEGAKNDGEVGVKLVMTKLDHSLTNNYFSPDAASNYIVTAIPAVGIVAGGEDYEGGNMKFTVDYYDGLGRFDQSVFQRGQQDRSTVLACTQYDSYGRPDRRWNPVPGTDDGGRMEHNEIAAASEIFYGDRAAYSTTIYADSPLERVARQFGPGEIWRRDNSAVDFKYNTDALVKYSVIGDRSNGELVQDGYYVPGDLRIEEICDEDGHLTMKYCDCYGHYVCIECEGLKTFNVYDQYGNLRYVLPPCVNGNIQRPNLKQYAYIYNYNDRNLCIAQKLPGAEWVYFMYDKADYPVYSQDGEQRARGKWICSIPDVFGREVIRALASSVSDADELSKNSVIAVFDKDSPSGYFMKYAPEYDSLLCVNYYDNYDFMLLGGTPGNLKYREDSAYGRRYGNDIDEFKHKGLLTGSFGKILGSGGELVWTAYYYDINQRPIQTRRLFPSGGEHVVQTKYNFNGTIDRSEEAVRPDASTGWDVVHTKNKYDEEGRLSAVSICLNDTLMAVTSYGYDAVGRMISVTDNEAQPEPICTQMRYNVRNWPVSSANREFESKLFYVDSLEYGTRPNYAGNISEWKWTNGGHGMHTYCFAYDEQSRLTEASLYGPDGVRDRFAESGITYDGNGNILHMDRTSAGLPANSLYYSYAGNQLAGIHDKVSGDDWGYHYDYNGQMTYDGRNNLYLTYNIAGLPHQFGDNYEPKVTYSYLPDGTKLSVLSTSGDGLYYIGSMVYRKSGCKISFEGATFPGGRFVRRGSSVVPCYYLADHLGSTRAIVDGISGEVLERNDYYPYGSRWSTSSGVYSGNRYLFNGKESQSFAGIPYLDYGARLYDPAFRLSWNKVDPLAEKYYSVSPYAFCCGNPVNFVDWDGERLLDKNGQMITYTSGQGWSDNVTDEQKRYLVMLQRTQSGGKLVDAIIKADVDVTIEFTDEILINVLGETKSGQNTLYLRNGNPVKSEILLSRPGMARGHKISKKYKNIPLEVYRAMVLAHELQHVFNESEYDTVEDQENDSDAKMEEYLRDALLPKVNTSWIPKYL